MTYVRKGGGQNTFHHADIRVGIGIYPFNASWTIGTRHLDRANFLFLDGHAAGYGAPPLPLAPLWSEGAKWLVLNYAPPEGL